MTKFMRDFFKRHPRRSRTRRPMPEDHPYRTGYSPLPRLKINTVLTRLKRKVVLPTKKRAFKLEPTGRGRKKL